MSFIFLRNRVTGGAAFSPASLFASGEDGAWYEPSTTTCFTDTAGTTAASVGDAVARINDLSGNGNHATQGTAAARPLLQQTAGGLYYLAFDGSDDGMRTANGVLNSAAITFVSGFSNTKNISVCFGLPEDATLHTAPYFRFVFYRNVNNVINMRVNGVQGSGTVAMPSDVFVTTAANKLGSPRINGASVAYTHSTSDLTFPNSVPLLLGQNAAGNENADMSFFGFVGVNRTLTAQEISDTESYVANLSGVTL